MEKIKEKLEKFIDDNWNEFSNLGKSEVIECDVSEFDNDVLEYLELNYRFDFNGICVSFSEEYKNVWVENMEA